MSGSSGFGGVPSMNRPKDNEDCEALVINTNLASPQAAVVNNLSVGDILSISAVSDQGPIQAIDQNGHIAGSIISREMVRILNCISTGTEYEAEIISIENGQYQIQIHAV